MFLIPGSAHLSKADSNEGSKAPGFRPESKFSELFLRRLETCKIAVLPTVIRSQTTTTFSAASQKGAVDFLKQHKLGIAEAREVELDMGQLKGKAQLDWFHNDGKRLGEIVKAQSDADYYLTLEYLIPQPPSGGIAVFGVHIYVLDARGENAFSFLLNSHHEALVEAGLKSSDSTEQGRKTLVVKGTEVVLETLLRQIEQARSK